MGRTKNNVDGVKNEPIRVLHYIGSLNVGGSQTMMLGIYRNIDRSKIQFDFVVDRRGETFFKDEIESLGGRVYVLDEYFKGHNYFSFVKQWKRFFCEHPEYEIIHCHVRSVASIVLRIAKERGLKTICHSHNTSNGGGLKAVVKKILQRRISKYCDCFFACSEDAAKWLYGEETASSNRCKIINNAVEINRYQFDCGYRDKIRKRHRIADDVYIVGHVGRFERQKNHEFIFELIESLRGDDGIMFMLCGDGSLKADFQERVKAAGLDDRVIYIEGTAEIHKYYSAFDYFILPSRYEGLGMVLVEAQFSGLTCLASPNIPEEAKISENYIVEDLEVKKWRKKILEKKRNEAREKVKLLENAKNFDVTQTAKELQEFYVGCAGGTK